MSIRRFYTKQAVMKRLSSVSGYKKQFQSTATVDGHLQEMDRRAREKLGIIEERAWFWWTDIESDVEEGDMAVIGGVEYKVIEVTNKDYGVNQHKQVILEEPNE